MAERIDFQGRLDGKRRTPQGGLRVDSNLTRTGIFIYHYDANDGQGYREIREYRPADEVFKADSLETLKLAPVTVDHPEMIRTDNYKEHAVGVVAENVRARDQFIAADLLVQDQAAVAAIEAGDLVEISCGYSVDLVHTPGTTPTGERYDAIQTNIVYNHVAIGPKAWGRAGADVKMHLDSNGNSVLRGDYTEFMSDTDKARLDALTAATSRADKAEAERDAVRQELAETRDKLSEASANLAQIKVDTMGSFRPSEIPALVQARVALETAAKAIVPAGKFDGMSDTDIVAHCLTAHDAKLDQAGKSADYLRARFDAAVEMASRADAAVAALAVKIDSAISQSAAPAVNDLEKARQEFDAARVDTLKAGPPAGALTRK